MPQKWTLDAPGGERKGGNIMKKRLRFPHFVNSAVMLEKGQRIELLSEKSKF